MIGFDGMPEHGGAADVVDRHDVGTQGFLKQVRFLGVLPGPVWVVVVRANVRWPVAGSICLPNLGVHHLGLHGDTDKGDVPGQA